MKQSRKRTDRPVSRKRRAVSCISSFLKGFIRTLLICFLLLAAAGVGGAVVWAYFVIERAPEISMETVEPQDYATHIYDSEGNLTETLVTSGSNREEVSYDDLPENLVHAFVAIEDQRFWEHDGIDLRSIARAAVGMLSGDYAGGGSTITQQLIKNNVLAGGREKTWEERFERKLQEQYLAVMLERNSGLSKEETKEEILTDYLNSINLGSNTLGVKTAARRYFGKDLQELTLGECAVLAAIPPNPSRYNPITHPEFNEERRALVLDAMYSQGYISETEREAALEEPVYETIAIADAQADTGSPYSYFTDELINQAAEGLAEELGYTRDEAITLLYTGGLRIESTQDPDIQAIVDEEVNRPENYSAALYSPQYRLSLREADGSLRHYSERDLIAYRRNALGNPSFEGLYSTIEDILSDAEQLKASLLTEGVSLEAESLEPILEPQVSFVLMDQETGQVKAISGGRGEKTASLTLNRASDTLRQPGSVFKVLTAFAPAMELHGATLGTVYYDAPYSANGRYFHNWWGSRGYVGYSNIREGMVYSMNVVAVRAMMETGSPREGVEFAQNMGITSLSEQDYNPATALGGITNGVSNLELTAAYAAIADGGMYKRPMFFTRILDRHGKVILEADSGERRVMKETTAFLLTDAMAESVTGGRLFTRPEITISPTNRTAALERMPVSGKSGTTTDNRDIWFVGFTPYYTAGVWGGCDENQSLRHGNVNNGGVMYHKDIWRQIMNRVHQELPEKQQAIPNGIVTANICRKSGKLAVSGLCDQDPRGNAVYQEYFAAGTAPTETCDVHGRVLICQDTGLIAGDFCPNTAERVCMILPAGEDGATDDGVFAAPYGYCQVHRMPVVEPLLPEEEENFAEENSEVQTDQEPADHTEETMAQEKDGSAEGYGPGFAAELSNSGFLAS